ncbi:enoyl-CoA hydratase/isomerase family protein [Ramlibacter sp.]|uniref:enoyl-CoA hydratase/isomerase family protein n=1 Tax=Ramlibacter sp. TaxID=1917967 RepID=UPI003D0B7023
MSAPSALRHMKFETVADGVALVTFARPEVKNAFNRLMMDEALAIVDELAAGYPARWRAVVVCGEGDNYCCGGDLEMFREMLGQPRHAVHAFIARFHQWALAWDALPMPTLAVMHGPVVGGGVPQGLICDLRYAAENTVVHFNFMHIGLVPDMGSHFIVPSLVGVGRAYELMLAGEPIDAAEGLRLGLFTKVLPTREEALAAATKRASVIAAVPPDVVAHSKRLLRNARHSSLSETVAQEVACQADRFLDPVFAEKIAGFFAKRARRAS